MASALTLIIELIIMNTFVSMGHIYQSDTICTIMIGLSTAAYIYDVSNSRKNSLYSRELLIGYFWRLFLLYFDMYGKNIYQLPNSGADSHGFFLSAMAYAGVEGGRDMGSFPFIMGNIFKVIGINQLYGQFLMMMCSILAIHALIHILEILRISLESKKTIILIVCLLPNFAILSVIFLREAPVTMMISISLLFFVLWFTRKYSIYLILALVFDFGACYLHSGSIGIAVGYIIVLLLYNQRQKKFKLSALNLIEAGLITMVLAYLYLNYSNILFSKIANVDEISDVANTLTYGGSTYAQYVGDSSSLTNMVIYTIPRIVYFLFSPFPWQWRGISDIIAFLFSSMFYLFTVYMAIKNINNHEKNNKNITVAILIIMFCVVFIFAWGVANTGTAARHRDKLVTIFATLGALGLHRGEYARD